MIIVYKNYFDQPILSILSLLKKLTKSDIDPIFVESRKGDVRDSLADISKAKRLLDYHPTVKIEEGLKRTFEWFKGNQEFIEDRN